MNKLLWFGIICAILSSFVGLATPAMGAAVPYIPPTGSGASYGPGQLGQMVKNPFTANDGCNSDQYLVGPDRCCPVGDNYSGGLCLSRQSPKEWIGPIVPSGQGNTSSQLKVEFNPYSTDQFSSMSLYLNTTDNHVHFKGLLTNLLHETVYGPQTNLFGPLMAFLNATGHKSNFGPALPGPGQLSFTLSFEDNATGTQLKSVSGSGASWTRKDSTF